MPILSEPSQTSAPVAPTALSRPASGQKHRDEGDEEGPGAVPSVLSRTGPHDF